MSIVYLNGQFLPLEQAQISVMDRGFLFGDGVYEVIPIFNKKLLRPQQHLQRLKQSLAILEIPCELDETKFLSIIKELLLKDTQFGDTKAIYLQITRGSEGKRNHVFPEIIQPTVFIQCFEVKSKTATEMRQGATAITAEDIRWQWCYIKTINLLPNVLLAEKAKRSGAVETILIRDGLAMEGTSSNLFIVKNQVIITPPANKHILCGVTRDLMLELAAINNMPFVEGLISKTALMEADEVWVTGSVKEIVPIISIDGQPIGNGKVGLVCGKMIDLYEKNK